mmetsp:Transcript_1763/g.10865  ORF Transcript_1763/g.10865 Transcript_1763/m.10865 type:complete len:253 (+) Transcript_1763:511-1269(+)
MNKIAMGAITIPEICPPDSPVPLSIISSLFCPVALGVVEEPVDGRGELVPPAESKDEPFNNERDVNITKTEMESQERNVRSFAKNVLGSTRVRTIEGSFCDPFLDPGCPSPSPLGVRVEVRLWRKKRLPDTCFASLGSSFTFTMTASTGKPGASLASGVSDSPGLLAIRSKSGLSIFSCIGSIHSPALASAPCCEPLISGQFRLSGSNESGPLYPSILEGFCRSASGNQSVVLWQATQRFCSRGDTHACCPT